MKNVLSNEKTWNLIGAILGLVVILVGLVFMFTPADSYSTKTTDYATFGGDYYTYQYDATRAVASNAAITANNLRELGGKLAVYAGTFFMVLGALISLNYGKKLLVCSVDAPAVEAAPAVEPAPAAEPVAPAAEPYYIPNNE